MTLWQYIQTREKLTAPSMYQSQVKAESKSGQNLVIG
jgi:hypothetical protein